MLANAAKQMLAKALHEFVDMSKRIACAIDLLKHSKHVRNMCSIGQTQTMTV